MKKLSLLTAGLAFAALLVFATPIVTAQDMVKVAPKNCKVLLENDQVRVVRVVEKPGEKLEMHSHPANIIYTLTSGKVKFTSPDGKTAERELKAGQAVWSDAVTHSSENVGTTASRVLVIELKK
jgi:quercetin dioxygenase-like cupin family protein